MRFADSVCASVFFSLCTTAFAADGPNSAPPEVFRKELPELVISRQLILVTNDAWQSVSAQLACFERAAPNASWNKVFGPSPAVIGRNGLAWGIGLHGSSPPGENLKREGDGRAPAGVYALEQAFGYAPPKEARVSKFPYMHLTSSIEGIDDPGSRYYNRIVDSRTVDRKDWRSSEQMRRNDELYRWGIIVSHNARQYPGYGSCIFLHGWMSASEGTAGCTALPIAQVETIVRWLDQAKHPILVQLPLAKYEQLKVPWKLPEL